MYLDEVYLSKENELFVFERRQKRLFRIVRGERCEETDRDVVARIVTGPAHVLSGELIGLCHPPPAPA